MKFGLCCGPQTMAQEGASLRDNLARLQDVLCAANADYFEMGVGQLMDDEFEELAAQLEDAPVPLQAFNGFLPATLRITGPDVELQSVLNYCETALQRCHQVDGRVVVLGSSGARKVPDGFSLERADEQFIEFGRALGPIAANAGIMIAIEPLNRKEDNFINDVARGAQLVEAINHPHVQLLADWYHMNLENETLDNIAHAGKYLQHVHVASKTRKVPLEGADDGLEGFFAALEAIGYNERCSFEGGYRDFASEAPAFIALMKQLHREARAENAI